jgi:hypothetical protein
MPFSWLASATAILMVVNAGILAAEPMNLRVLYAGNSGSDRAKDFVSFLEKHFSKVRTVDFGKFQEADAKDYDVVLFDWTSIYPRNKEGKIDNSVGNITMPPGPRLSPEFAKPTILIGAAGGQVAGTRQLKINWL